jgi:deoxycytidylate deaminase
MSESHTELVVALVAAVGTDVGMVAEQVAVELTSFSYDSEVFHLSDYLAEQADHSYDAAPFDEKLWAAMSEGDSLRQSWERNDALALQAISDIVATREERAAGEIETCPGEPEPANLDRFAFILRSLKTPDELDTLRAVYGPRLVVIAAYSPMDRRIEHLATEIEDSRKNRDRATWTYQPEDLIARDEKEQREGGQDVSGTFHRADFFVRAWDRDVARTDLERTIAILFGDPFCTPTRDEYGQFQAAGAALRSSEMGRQVGAAITTAEGSLVALGSNEVPTYQGGSHWEEDGEGNRDFEIGDRDTNRAQFDKLAGELAAAVSERLDSVIAATTGGDSNVKVALDSVRDHVVSELPGDLRRAGLKDLTEFGRAVHAEMNAILDAGRRGVPINGATIHTTTFPCHNCARHIVGAGIRRVVFIEPYAKSRAGTLHDDAIAIDLSDPGGRVSFQPFVGVAPQRYLEMFDAAARVRLGHIERADEGVKRELDKGLALPVFVDAVPEQFRPELPGYRAKELLALEHYNQLTAGGGEPETESETENPSDAGAKRDVESNESEEDGSGEP